MNRAGQTWVSNNSTVLVVESQPAKLAGQTHHVYVFLSSSWNPDLVGKRKTVLEISDRFWEDIGPSWTRLT